MKLEMRERLWGARELIELAIVDACLEALDVALRLEHADIEDEPPCERERESLTYARRVVRSAADLRTAIANYRRVMNAELDVEADGLPF